MRLRKRKPRSGEEQVDRQVRLLRGLEPDDLATWIRFYRSETNEALTSGQRLEIARRLAVIRGIKLSAAHAEVSA